jgi:hypothetical protein
VVDAQFDAASPVLQRSEATMPLIAIPSQLQRDTGCCSTLPSSLPLPSNFMPLPLLWRLQELLLMQRDRTHCHVHSSSPDACTCAS